MFKNIVHTLNHVYVIDLIFQAHLEGRDHGFTARNMPDWPPLAEPRRKQRTIYDRYIAWSDDLVLEVANIRGSSSDEAGRSRRRAHSLTLR